MGHQFTTLLSLCSSDRIRHLLDTVVAKRIADRHSLWGNQLPVTDAESPPEKINFHFRDRSVGMPAESLSEQIQIIF